ncbi:MULTISPECIES: prolyl-tRNA synthetase associated domain-containing protein [unclassified Roseitalea]|uniref:prolyl-tRNA synthetase associated domain-containing protein n=1 Tax=unclassified Roseitalea TaxID=2639107 RepID=UPI00273F32FF|nr:MULTISPECIES: prolyl-tRNA synthetase associated domain-containing protein [unclassified Roseitalea]
MVDARTDPPAATGSPARNSGALLAYLDSLGIDARTVEHRPVFTVAESQQVRDSMPGAHTKNLFVKDRKGRHFLLTVPEDGRVDLKSIHRRIGASGRVSFAGADALMALLGVVPGAVTPFGIINDKDRAVTLIFDAALMDQRVIHAHPLRNDATTAITPAQMRRFVEAVGHDFNVLKLAGEEAT